MAFTVPVFNIAVKMWRLPNAPPAAATSTFNAQLYFTPRPNYPITPASNTQFQPPIYLRCAMGTDVKPGDVIEAASGDGWYYRVRWVDRCHRGFPNEYLACLLEQGNNLTPPGPGPFPPPPPPPPAGGGPYYGYAGITSAGAAVNNLALGGVALASASDRCYLACLAVSALAPIMTATCNGAPATNIGGAAAVGPYLGQTGDLRIFEGNPGAGPVAWVANCAGLTTAYIDLISINLTNPGAANIGYNGVSGASPAAPTVAMAAPVAAVPTPLLSACGCLQTVGNVEAYVAPFVDVGAQVAQAFLGMESTLNLACYGNPPLGVQTAVASVPTTPGQWGIEVFGKH
jgi:hypothetical protein